MTTVIPAINCIDFACAQEKVRTAEKFFPFGGGWIHLDVADAKFTFNKTWGNPGEWRKLYTNLNLEVHLMVEDPEQHVAEWIQSGAKRIIVHVESVKDEARIVELCRAHGVEPMLSFSPETPIDGARMYFEHFSSFHILGVTPGLAGQPFIPRVLDKVRFLREHRPSATIEVDGGMNVETAQAALDAGANIIIAASYVFGYPKPANAYMQLASLEAN